ncbi:MAG: 50S ribosomal protein L21 [Dehalococcoidia bacterium]|nr:50S ribosomal protein L21 [Dehalococcoidia bacterium]
MYAIVESGGKQYKVTPRQTLDVDKLEAPQGESVEFDRVLLVSDGDNTLIGSPTVSGAKVVATSQGMVKGDKVVVFRYKNKTRSRRKNGFRAQRTRLTVDRVVMPGE